MHHISENEKRKFYESFDRTEEVVNDYVDVIQAWMKTQPHLPEMMENVKVRNFLHLNKFSIEKTKQRIDMYYTIRSVIPEPFEDCNPKSESFKEFFDKTYLFLFPEPLDNTHRIYFLKNKEPNGFDPLNVTRLCFAIFEVRIYEDFIIDDIIIMDMSNFTLHDIQQCTPSLVSKFFTIYKKVYALRLKKFIFIHCPIYVNVFMTVLKSVMSPKIYQRIELHQDDSVLKELLPKGSVPKDYGGDGPSLDELNENIQKKLLEYQDRFDKLETLKVDESLRPEKLNNDEILGFYGNFRKMNVD